MHFNYYSEAHTKFIKGEGMKKKRCWKIIIFISAFYEKDRKKFGTKSALLGQGPWGKSAFSKEDHFHGRVSQQKRPGPNVKKKQNCLCGSHGLNLLSCLALMLAWTIMIVNCED